MRLLPRSLAATPFGLVASMLLIFYGSHAGYYSHYHSSQSLSLLLAIRGFLERNPNFPYRDFVEDRKGARLYEERFGR